MADRSDFEELFEKHGIPFAAYVESEEPTETVEVDAGDLHAVLDEIGFPLADGDVAGRLDCGEELNLLAVNTAMALMEIHYAPEVFPGLVYVPEEVDATVVVYDDGQLATVDAADAGTARDALAETCRTLASLRLVDDEPPEGAVEAPVDSVPLRT